MQTLAFIIFSTAGFLVYAAGLMSKDSVPPLVAANQPEEPSPKLPHALGRQIERNVRRRMNERN